MRRQTANEAWIVLLLLAALVLFADDAHPQGRSVAYDYSNTPDWQALTDFDAAVLSPRACESGACDSLTARGVEVMLWLQAAMPCTWRGQAIRDWSWDGEQWSLADRYGVLTGEAGDTAFVSGPDISGCAVIDLSVSSNAAHDLARSVIGLGSYRIVLDYAGLDRWELSLSSVSRETWEAWRPNYALFRSILADRLVCQNDRLIEGCRAYLLEKIGWTLTPYDKAHDLAGRSGPGGIYQATGRESRRRRFVAALAYAFDGYASWGRAHPHENLSIRELEDLYLGRAYSPAWKRAPGVSMRIFTHGLVIVNTSGRPHRYGRRTIANNDALVVQFRDEETGRWQRWQTSP